MSYKQFVPDTSEDWDTYWTQTSIEAELDKTKTDGLAPIFQRYLKKNQLHLEAGCGLGKWVISLKQKGYSIIGLDTYHKGLSLLKKYDPKLPLVTSDVNSLSLKDHSIDTYISLGVVEHFESGPELALKEAFRVLKPGGKAIIEVPFDSPLRQLSRFVFSLKVALKTPARLVVEFLKLRPPRRRFPMKFYEYRYTRQELKNFCRQAGFQVKKILPKDDLDPQRSIMLWSDYPWLRHSDGQIFHLNSLGTKLKRLLHRLSPFSYSALIVAICQKPKNQK